MIRILKKLAANRNLLKNLVLRDLKHRYVGSMGGFLWSVIHPLVLLISYTFVFSVVLRQRLSPDAGTDSFAIFLFCGFLPWLLFSDTVMRNCSVVTDNAPLITKTVIPAEVLPVSITLSNLFNHMIWLAILLAFLLRAGTIHVSIFYILIYMPILLMLSQGIGWIAASLHVFVRDTSQILQILLILWMWFTPIFYSLDVVPNEYRGLFKLNPMVLIVTGYRNSLLNTAQPTPFQVLTVTMASAAVFIAGALIFRQTKPAFADVL